jgi:hypothetical protein
LTLLEEYKKRKKKNTMGRENTSGGKGTPVPPAPPSRLRRKSAKAAAALVSAVAKEEVNVPEEPRPRPTPVKRSYARSQSAPVKASARVASSSSSSSGGNSHSSKKKTALSQHAVQYLKNWLLSPAHIEHPYPTEEQKIKIMEETGIEIKQLTNWFVNNRKRYWKPKVEEYKRRSSETKLTVKQIAAQEWMGLSNDNDDDSTTDNNAIVSDEGSDNEKQQQPPKKKKQRTSVSSKSGGSASGRRGAATITPANSPKAKRNYKNAKSSSKQGATAPPVLPVLTAAGISTAKSHATVKASNAMRHVVGDTSSSSSSEIEEEIDDIEEDAATIFSSSTAESKVFAVSTTDADMEATEELASMPLEEMGNPGCGCGVADPLSYKIVSFFRCSLLFSVQKINLFSNTRFSFSIHFFCFQSHNGEPCALCAACRDWNAGEFCPWDLTGIIGNIQSETPSSLETMDATDICNPVALERTVSAGDDLDVEMIASPSTSTFETPQDTANETWDIGDTW